MAQRKRIRLGTMRLRVRSLASLSVAMSCGIGRRCGSDLALLWLWRRPATTTRIRPLAWKTPYAMGAALKGQKTKYIYISYLIKYKVIVSQSATLTFMLVMTNGVTKLL